MAITGNEVVEVVGVTPTGAPSGSTERVTTQQIANLSGVSKTNIAYKFDSYVAVGDNMPQVLANNSTADTTNNTFNSRRLTVAPATSAITDIILGFAGFATVGGVGTEIVLPNNYTVTASIEYPIGTTPTQVTFNGATSLTVTPCKLVFKSDAMPIYIPAGAEFAVKCFVSWTGAFWYGNLAATFAGEWTNVGTGLADHTLDLTNFSNNNQGGFGGFSAIIYGRIQVQLPVVGVAGDSISVGTSDAQDGTYFASGVFARGLHNKASMLGLGIGGATAANFVITPFGKHAAARDHITHLIIQLIVNDISAGTPLATLQSNLQAIAEIFQVRGTKIFGWTCMPHTSSTDGWISYANQTVTAFESTRVAYNAWLRANWQSLGFSGLIDADRAIDPTATGKWGFDAGASVVYTSPALGIATLSGGTVASVTYTNGSAGAGFGNNVTVPWVAQTWPGETGSGASGTATSNSSGQLTTWTVTNPGNNYQSPPLIAPSGIWTVDGLHPIARGVNQIIVGSGFSPSMFAF